MNKTNETTIKSPIMSRGLNGSVEGTSGTTVEVGNITLQLDRKTAWALCNMLTDGIIKTACDRSQREPLSNLGAALGRLIDHPAANNGGREILK